MIDYHCHLDLYSNPLDVFKKVKERNVDVLAVTTSPRAYRKTCQYFSTAKNVQVALGFHPELVPQRIKEVELFMNYLPSCNQIGEIGIDNYGKNKATVPIQAKFFKKAIVEIEKNSPKIISIHSRGAVKSVLEILEENIVESVPILHWYTGSIKQIDWAISLGCWFSINPQMCCSSSGRRIISKIPTSRILSETDGPFAQKNGQPYMPWDNSVITYLSNILDTSTESVDRLIQENLNIINAKC